MSDWLSCCSSRTDTHTLTQFTVMGKNPTKMNRKLSASAAFGPVIRDYYPVKSARRSKFKSKCSKKSSNVVSGNNNKRNNNDNKCGTSVLEPNGALVGSGCCRQLQQQQPQVAVASKRQRKLPHSAAISSSENDLKIKINLKQLSVESEDAAMKQTTTTAMDRICTRSMTRAMLCDKSDLSLKLKLPNKNSLKNELKLELIPHPEQGKLITLKRHSSVKLSKRIPLKRTTSSTESVQKWNNKTTDQQHQQRKRKCLSFWQPIKGGIFKFH